MIFTFDKHVQGCMQYIFLAIVDFNHLTFDLTNAWRSQRLTNHVLWKNDNKEVGKTTKKGEVCFKFHQV